MQVWFYDIECLLNFHSFYAINRDTREEKCFIIHESRNDIIEYLSFLNSLRIDKGSNVWMIGFNNINYDYPILHYIMTVLSRRSREFDNPNQLTNLIRKENDRIIKLTFSAIAPWKVLIRQIDPYKIHHYDNPSKRCSLKYLEAVLRMNELELYDDFNKKVLKKEIDNIIHYNKHDVKATELFFNETLPDLNMRIELSKEYDRLLKKHHINLLNCDDPKLGSELFAMLIAEEKVIEFRELKKLRTYRGVVYLKDCILDIVKFKTKEFNYILDCLKDKYVEEVQTKKKLSAITKNIKGLYKNNPYKIRNIKIKQQSPDKFVYIEYKNTAYTVGIGGIHGVAKSGRYIKNDKYLILDTDVASFYPALSVENNFHPKHLGKVFCRVFGERYRYRVSIKKIKGMKSIAGGWKLGLNGATGLGQNEHSFLYDLAFPLKIRINGELLLLMLIEVTLLNIDCHIIQINTDGFTMKINRNQVDEYKKICKDWEKLTRLNLEFDEFREIGVSDVNNYYAIYDKPQSELTPQFPESHWYDNRYTFHKTKGKFQIVPEANGKIAYHKSWDHRIVQKAAYDYFVFGNNPKETIRNCTNILDFCCIYKSTSLYETYYDDKDGIRHKLGKVIRYYVSSGGVKLIKIKKKDKSVSKIEAGYSVTLFNERFDYDDFSKYKIDYTFYIREVYKLIDSVEQVEQLTLGAF